MQQPSNLQVVLMGVITVFICLTILIGIIYLMGALMRRMGEKSAPVQSTQDISEIDGDRQAVIAAISAAIAEDSAADISRIRIHSIKRISQ